MQKKVPIEIVKSTSELLKRCLEPLIGLSEPPIWVFENQS